MVTLYEEIFEAKKPRKCEDCLHYDACNEFGQSYDEDADKCDHYEEDKSLYEELVGNEKSKSEAN